MSPNVPSGAAMPVRDIPVDFEVAMEVATHEALIRQAYKDSVGVWTWCVGMTNATGHHVQRYIGNPASLQQCMNIYAWALSNYAAGVRRAFAGHQLTKAQFAAALSFHWNTGAIERATWVKYWKAGETAKAKKAFMNWVTPSEIKGRREKERDLFFGGVWSQSGRMTEFTRLTANHTPVWGSAVSIDVRKELQAAFAKVETPVLDAAPQPDAKVEKPTLSPANPAPINPDPDLAPDAPRAGGVNWLGIVLIGFLVIAGIYFIFIR